MYPDQISLHNIPGVPTPAGTGQQYLNGVGTPTGAGQKFLPGQTHNNNGSANYVTPTHSAYIPVSPYNQYDYQPTAPQNPIPESSYYGGTGIPGVPTPPGTGQKFLHGDTGPNGGQAYLPGANTPPGTGQQYLNGVGTPTGTGQQFLPGETHQNGNAGYVPPTSQVHLAPMFQNTTTASFNPSVPAQGGTTFANPIHSYLQNLFSNPQFQTHMHNIISGMVS